MIEFESIRLREEQETKPKPKSTAYVVVVEKTDSNLVIDGKLAENQPFKKQLNPNVESRIYFDYDLRAWVLSEVEK